MFTQYRRLLVNAIYAFLLVAVCLGSPAFAAGNTIATVIGVRGHVDVKRAGGASYASIDSQGLLYSGDVIRAASDGYASLLFADGSQAKLKANSSILITKKSITNTSQSFFKALAGVIWAHMNPNSTIETPAANIIVRGTDILVSVAPNGTVTLIVLSGSADLVSNHGTVHLTSGEETSAAIGGVPSAPVPVDVSGLDQWTYLNIVVPSEGVMEAVDPYTGLYTASGPADFSVPVDTSFAFSLPAIFIPAVPLSYLVSSHDSTAQDAGVPNTPVTPAPEQTSGVQWLELTVLVVGLSYVVRKRKAHSIRYERVD